MRRHSMSDHEGFRHLRPQTPKDRRSLFSLVGFSLTIIFCIAGLFYLKHRVQKNREKNWNSAVATIEDVRTISATQDNSQMGGAMLYDVQILAKYSVDGSPNKRWITVMQKPQHLVDAQLEAFRWKGKICYVRWKPSDPNQIVAEVS
jgi:hypothetical protein